MEKTPNDLIDFFSIIPPEIQQHIATYLDAPALGFSAQSHKQALKNILPVLIRYQALFPLRLTANWGSTFFSQANQLFVCGDNKYGQLGLGDTAKRSTFTAVTWPKERGTIQQIIAGEVHIAVLTHDNQLWVCGNNACGQLGLGNQVNYSTFTAVPWSAEQGKIQQVITHGYHTIVLTQDKRLWACGENGMGQLGLGDQIDRTTFTAVPWPKERGTIQQIVTGGEHTVVLTEDNRLWVCGSNEWGQLGLGDKEDRFTFIAVPWPTERGKIQQVIAGACHTGVLTQDNRLWMCGENVWGQLGLGDHIKRFTFTAMPWPKERINIQQTIASYNHTGILTKNNRLWVCGNNGFGQLAFNDKKNRLIFTTVPWPEKRSKIKQVSIGGVHTIMITQDNKLWVCGYNGEGQLGLGDHMDCATFTPVKALPEAMQQVFTLNHMLNQLVNLGTSLTLKRSIQSGTFPRQCHAEDLIINLN